MKKSFALILLVIYSVTSFGMTLNMHYCCGKLDKVTFSAQVAGTCKFMMPHTTKGCCDNKKLEIKVKLDQEVNSNYTALFSPQIAALSKIYTSPLFFLQKVSANIPETYPPPNFSAAPLFIQYCVYRI